MMKTLCKRTLTDLKLDNTDIADVNNEDVCTEL